MSQEQTAEINVSVTFRHTESTAALKQYAVEKLTHCVLKYVRTATDLHVVLSVEKRDHIVEVNVKAKDFDISSKAVTADLYSAIDKVVDTVEVQLRNRRKEPIRTNTNLLKSRIFKTSFAQ